MSLKEFGLIGFPLSHSYSKKIFEEIFLRENIHDGLYNLFPIKELSVLPVLLKDHPQLQGLNVTIPYKEGIIEFLDYIDPEAAAIGAVNCIKIDNLDGRAITAGYNTDMPAFTLTIQALLQKHHKQALVLGSGGASRAVSSALKNLGIPYRVISRNPVADQLSYNDLTNIHFDEYQVIINATPIGMFLHLEGFPRLPYEKLTNRHLLYDLVYNPEMTEFLKKGSRMGATVTNGMQMLYMQAELSWKIWNNTAE